MSLKEPVNVVSSLLSATLLLLPASIIVTAVVTCIYRVCFHPLGRVPGPLLAKCTSLWQILHSYVGDECTIMQTLHHRYGNVVRIGPNMIDIADGAALGPIYVDKGGFPKPSCYHNAYTDGFATIFSTTDPAYRATRAKAVAPLFSSAAIHRDREHLYQCVERFVQNLRKYKEVSKSRPVDLQRYTRALGLDVLASYLFRHRPSKIQMQIEEGAMIPWLDFIVDAGQFFYFPARFFRFCVAAYSRFRPQGRSEANASKLVREYTMDLASDAESKDNTFQRKLLKQGVSREEIAAECKSMMVAGTHSFGSVLAMTLWHLAKEPTVYSS